MKNIYALALILFIVAPMLISCSSIEDSLSREEAVEKFMEENREREGGLEILSVDKYRNTYIIEWQDEEKLERGRDRIDRDGRIRALEREEE